MLCRVLFENLTNQKSKNNIFPIFMPSPPFPDPLSLCCMPGRRNHQNDQQDRRPVGQICPVYWRITELVVRNQISRLVNILCKRFMTFIERI